jgi:hypothetical protein
VTAAARAAEGPFWWELEPISCGPAGGARPPDWFAGQVAYHESDRTARELAERLVAVAATGAASLRTAPHHTMVEIESSRRQSAVVIPIPRFGTSARACALGLGDATIVPLVDTRATALVRRSRARVTAEATGDFRIFPAPATTE